MKSLIAACAAFLLFALLVPATLNAQEWSAAQKEVWKNVDAYWALEAAGNVEGFLSYFHNDYMGWNLHNPLPGGKEEVRKFVAHSQKGEKTLLYHIKPAGIAVFGDVALADYYYTRIYKDVEGKEKTEEGRWLDVLKKQGDKWVLIGDHGGRKSDD
ncbi:nuclear transport factor 2 family protein [bacterium]|nr:nuclear transport factor 2 family protein [bacterium]